MKPSGSKPATPKVEALERALAMQKKAREQAESLLEDKSRELYYKNTSLRDALEKLNEKQAQLLTNEKLATVGQLGASLAHELNNPNAYIQNNIVVLEEYINQLATGLESALSLLVQAQGAIDHSENRQAITEGIAEIRQNSDLDYIKRDLTSLMRESLDGTKRINNIANGLRFFANPDLSKKRALDVSECVHNARQLIRSNDQLVNLNFETEKLELIQGMPLLLSQAIANLIQNAIEASTTDPTVIIKAYRETDTILIEVIDRGKGIIEENMAKAFKAFYSTKPGHNGLGLGMAKQIVEQHDGNLSLQNLNHHGLCARIAVPFKPIIGK